MKTNSQFDSSILLVDDDIDLLEAIKDEVKEHFSSVIAVDRAAKAIELLKNQNIHCVITDYKMPEMNGLEFISFLEKNYPTIPVILLTGNGSDPAVLDSIENGLFDYVDKPFQSPVLINRIRNALLLPRLESLILALVRSEFPDISIDRFLAMPPIDRLKAINALEAIILTRLMAKEPRKSA